MATSPAAPSTPIEPAQGAFSRLIGVFISPGETFADIARKPSFVAPLILVILCSLASAVLVTNRIGMENIVRKQIAASPQGANIPADQREQAVERGAKVGKVFVYIGPIVFTPIVLCIVAGILLMMANFVMGGEAKFSQLFAITAHSWLPAVIMAIIAVIIIYLKDPADVDVQNVVLANLSPLFDAENHKVLYRLGQSIDLFSFWQIALLGAGVSASARLSYAKGVIAVVIPWVLYVGIAVGLKAIF